MDYDFDVILNFETEEQRDDFIMAAVTSREINIVDEKVKYSGEKSVLTTSDQAEILSKLTEKFNGRPGSLENNISPPPPSTYKEMVDSWNGLMKELKDKNSPQPI